MSKTSEHVDRILQYTGTAVLLLDLVWAVAWLVVGIVVASRIVELPFNCDCDLPRVAFDAVAEYRAAHRVLAFHFLLPGVIFLIASGVGGEPIIIWYSLPIGAVVATDIYANLENWLHLSREAQPDLFVTETIMATAALFISGAAFVWYQIVYWRLRLSGRRFDEAAHRKKNDHHPLPEHVESTSASIRALLLSQPFRADGRDK